MSRRTYCLFYSFIAIWLITSIAVFTIDKLSTNIIVLVLATIATGVIVFLTVFDKS